MERVEPGRATFDGSPRLPDLALVRFARVDPVDPAPYPARARLARELVEHAPRLGPAARSSLTRDEYTAGVERILEHIRAGECYQVNLTRRLTATRTPDPIALFGALDRPEPRAARHVAARPARERHGGGVAASPELFLVVRPGRRSRPARSRAPPPTPPRCVGQREGPRRERHDRRPRAQRPRPRVCDRLDPRARAVRGRGAPRPAPPREHRARPAAATTSGSARSLRATFPPASVTGAPKPRVMQAIEDLEPVRRGVYCGAVGWIDGDRGDDAELAVAIRTFTIASPADTHLGVGGGIVADSRPDAEWAETELKAARAPRRRGEPTRA